jgi:hypothetical protein
VPEVLEPTAAAEAGARHGQLASALPGGGLALSCHKLVEDGARTLILHVPGLFRLDVRPIEDTLQVTTRSLHERPTRWTTSETPFTDYGKTGGETREPSVVGFSFVVDAEPHPLAGRISLASTLDRDSGVTHFVAHALVREVPPAG